MSDFNRAGTQGQVQVGVATFVIVQVDVAETRAVGGQQVASSVAVGHEVGVANVEVQAKFGQRIHEFGQLHHGVERAGEIFNHQTDAEAASFDKEFAQALQIFFNDEFAVV